MWLNLTGKYFSCYNFVTLKPLIKDMQWNMLGWISSVTVPVSLGWFKPLTNVMALTFSAETWRNGCWKNQQPFWESALFACLYETTGHSEKWSDNIAVRIMSLCDVSCEHLAITGMKLPTDVIAMSITALGYGSTVHFHLADIPNTSSSGQVIF